MSVVLLVAAQVPLACGSDSRQSSSRGSEGGVGGSGVAEMPSAGGPDGGSESLAGATAEGGAGPQQEIGLDEYCSGIAELRFEFLSTCYGATDYPASAREDYIAHALERCLAVEVSVGAGRLAFDGVAAAACLAELGADESCSPFDFLSRAPGCEVLFSGQVEVGGDCYRDATLQYEAIGAASECQAGYCEGEQCPGTCQPWLEEGDTCAAGQCGPELACIDEACAPLRAEGEECPEQGVCRHGLTCVGNVCQLPSQPGDSCPCSSGFYCIEGECWAKVDAGHACTVRWQCSDDGRCLDRDGDGPEGLRCGPRGEFGDSCEQAEDCALELYCAREFQMPGTCQNRLSLMAECDGEGCERDLWCNYSTGLCQARGDEGDDCMAGNMPGPNGACSSDLLCMSDGLCHPVGSLGDPCHVRQAESCVAGTFCSRDGAVCAELAGMGDYCNPFIPACAQELGCLCTGDECAATRPTNEHDTLFMCAQRREPGEPCFGEFECETDGFCGSDPPVCNPSPSCLP